MTATLDIRPAERSDLAEIDMLLSRAYPALLKRDYPPSLLVTAIPLIARANPGLLASGTYFAARAADGRIVGAGGWTRRSPAGAGAVDAPGHVRHLVVDHRRQREGIGRSLMRRVLASARDAGLGELACLSTLTARPFYTACGFVTERPVMISLRPGIDFPVVLMRRTLEETTRKEG